MYWRRFSMSDIPLNSIEMFDRWIRERWVEKDELLDLYLRTGRFPAGLQPDASGKTEASEARASLNSAFIETEVRQAHWWEVAQVYIFLSASGILAYVLAGTWNFVMCRGLVN